MPFCKYCSAMTLDDTPSGYLHQPNWNALQASAQSCALCRLFKEEIHAALSYALRTRPVSDLEEEFIAKRGLLNDELPSGWDLGLKTHISVYYKPKALQNYSEVVVTCGPDDPDENWRFEDNHYSSFVDWNESRKFRHPDWASRGNATLGIYTHEGFAVTFKCL